VAGDPFEEALARGVAEFNRGRFFEAHDAWEDLRDGTRGPERRFLEGLIQAAVGLHHLNLGNLAGARSHLAQALEALAPWRPAHRDLDLDDLVAEIDGLLEAVRLAEGPSDLGEVAPPVIGRLHEEPEGRA
jgi:predicted metal-dependent hydrolase